MSLRGVLIYAAILAALGVGILAGYVDGKRECVEAVEKESE